MTLAPDNRDLRDSRTTDPQPQLPPQIQHQQQQQQPQQQNAFPICQNCSTSNTPLWRRDESGQVLCNACGLFLKLHGRPRPVSLKTDVIKSRNRIKNPHSTSHASPQSGSHSHSHANSAAVNGSVNGSRKKTDQISQQDARDAGAAHNQQTQAAAVVHTSVEALVTANQTLRTRVSELELVNDLFRSRISELESNEASARKSELNRRELEAQLQRKLEESSHKNLELQSRIDDLEHDREQLTSDRDRLALREQQMFQQQQSQLLHHHFQHQHPSTLPLPQTPASPALDGATEETDQQHLRKKMRVSDLVGGGAAGDNHSPQLPPLTSSRTGTPLQQVHSPQIFHQQGSHIPPLQLSPSAGNNGNNSSDNTLPAVNGMNGNALNRMPLPSVSSITLPPITAQGEVGR
ncbi:hypothetical protein V1512DRAFT_200611 [Lipomyces arxii]|uniref:uncharacterized protein n=1 Tax=Lipomyces arxii TaxID=56418 RepID=UPI0034CEA22C